MFQLRDKHILCLEMEKTKVNHGNPISKQTSLLEVCCVLMKLLRVRHLVKTLTACWHVSGVASSHVILRKDEQLCFGCQRSSKSHGMVMQRLNISYKIFQTAWSWSSPNSLNQVSKSCFIITAKGVMKKFTHQAL